MTTDQELTSIRNQLAEVQRERNEHFLNCSQFPKHLSDEAFKQLESVGADKGPHGNTLAGMIQNVCEERDQLKQKLENSQQELASHERMAAAGVYISKEEYTDLIQAKQKLIACEAVLMNLKSILCTPLQTQQITYSAVTDARRVLSESPQTSLTEALKGVREILSVPQNEIVSIGIEFVERSVAQQALSKLNKLIT